ncbi:type II toxin-antitoxin system HicA family toxin [Ciceribacter thiooxidans]|uniref:Type II toxin-antitoxin system HicA family toxin n=2 Tax=Ciceribacter thiooxidans TaxID=1969821 RepID=A0ABV7I313_9HYPH
MSRGDRLVEDFRACRGPFPYRDLVRMLASLGFVEKDAGGGSRRKFVHSSTKQIIRLHEPHPGNEMKPYMVRQIRDQFIDQGLI